MLECLCLIKYVHNHKSQKCNEIYSPYKEGIYSQIYTAFLSYIQLSLMVTCAFVFLLLLFSTFPAVGPNNLGKTFFHSTLFST